MITTFKRFIRGPQHTEVQIAKKERKEIKRDLQKVWKQYVKEKDPAKKRAIRASLIVSCFKEDGKGYEILTKDLKEKSKFYREVRKIKTCAEKIFDFQGCTVNEFLANHALDVEFAIDQRHFIYKHIQKLNEWKNKHGLETDYRIRAGEDGKLIFHTGETLESLIEEEKSAPAIRFDLDHFAVRRKDKDNPPEILQQNFQVQADGKYHIEIVTNARKRPLAAGNHSWIRLVSDDGSVYSVGKYPKKDFSLREIYSQFEVSYHNCDVTEWSEKDAFITAHSLQITKEQFERVKESIEDDLKNVRNRDYQTFEDNCTDWVIQKIEVLNDKEAGEQTYTVDREEIRCQQLETLAPKIASFANRWIPRCIRLPAVRFLLVCSHIMHLFLAFALCGTRKNRENPDSKPVLRKNNLTNIKLTYVTHPFYLKKWVAENWKHLVEDKSTSHPKKEADNVADAA